MNWVGMLLAVFLAAWPNQAAAEGKQVDLVRDARTVLLTALKAETEPLTVQQLGKARGIAIFPGLVKAGLIVGGRFGSGILLVRGEAGWSDPLFVSLVSASVGWQIGFQSMDLLLLFNTPLQTQQLTDGKVSLGADAGLAAGPVGGHIEGTSGLDQKKPVVAYSPTRGLFAGLSLEGNALQIDTQGNASYYAIDGITPEQILSGQVREKPLAGQRLQLELNQMLPAEH